MSREFSKGGNVVRPKACAVCQHSKGASVISEIALGRLTTDEAAKLLGVSRDKVQRHLRECLNTETLGIEYVLTLKELVEKLKTMTEDLEGRGTNPLTVKMMTSLVHEIRGLVRDVATLEGRLQVAPLIQINQLNLKLEKIQSFVLQKLPNKYQKLLLEQLEAT